ncbi:MAG: hypothetical protein ACXVHX_38010 [Solirubrobacteraceae bacterium]
MTLDVYAQLQQRVKREHGRAFDTLVRQAREQLYGTTSELPEPSSEPNLGHESGHEATLSESDGRRDERIGEQESSDLQADRGMARPGLELGTPRSSGLRAEVSNKAKSLHQGWLFVGVDHRRIAAICRLLRGDRVPRSLRVPKRACDGHPSALVAIALPGAH